MGIEDSKRIKVFNGMFFTVVYHKDSTLIFTTSINNSEIMRLVAIASDTSCLYWAIGLILSVLDYRNSAR